MNKMVLYRKELDLLLLGRKLLSPINLQEYIHSVRDAIPDLFYESNFNLKSEFVEIIPINKLGSIRSLLDFLKTISGSCSDSVSAHTGSQRKTVDICREIDDLCGLMKEQISLHSCFTVFYSWQSDCSHKVNRSFIEACIKSAIKSLNKDSEIKLVLDKDTRGEAGSPDIVNTILRKIDGAIAFVADVTSIKHDDEKEIPNPNVMCELGYALSSLSDERVVMICNTDNCDIKKLPFDLGLKRVLPYKLSEADDCKDKVKKELTENLEAALRAIRDL